MAKETKTHDLTILITFMLQHDVQSILITKLANLLNS
jgi:hypothetical protein